MREGYNHEEFDRLWGLAQASIRPSGNFEADAFILYGDRIDYSNTRLGKRLQMGPSITYNLGDHFRLSASHTYERMTVHDAHLYTANIVQLTAKYQFNIRTFIRTTLQYIDYRYNTSNYTYEQDPKYRRLYSEALFNYRINPRTVLFFGYSDAYHGNNQYDLTQSSRRFFTKVGYAWVL